MTRRSFFGSRRVRALAFACALSALGVSLFAGSSAYADTAPPAPSQVAPENDFADDIQGNVPGASAIEGRLMAPCCWTQTIDIHDSEIALSMRHEIRRRLRNGESADAIQASFVERYGPKIMAVQPNSQLKNVFIGLSVVMGGAGVAAALMLGRWRKQTTNARVPEAKGSGVRDQWDDKLDAELHELDGE
jgi:cytochrome c-type biogenesis protein CcmH